MTVDSPRDGLPEVIATEQALVAAAELLRSGSGPVALDAERASGFRYSQRAYLIQLRREGSGTHLIDPTAFPGLDPLQEALGGVPWILHAASQDLVCLADAGLTPTADLYDTELAGRLLGLPRVGLGPLVEAYLGVHLAKEHSAADWSTRPLPESWLTYAALDVEFLPELWELLHTDLVDARKLDFALQEFAHVRDSAAPVRTDPWRRTSGVHKVHHRADLAVVRAVWQARDDLAREHDIAPGRLLRDDAIVALALARTSDAAELRALPELSRRSAQRHAEVWVAAVAAARDLPAEEHPHPAPRSGGPPPPRAWADRNPEAFTRLEAARGALSAQSESLSIPVENLMSPELVRRVLWDPPTSAEALTAVLSDGGARPWQCDLVAPLLLAAIQN